MRRDQEDGRGRVVADYGSGGWGFESLAARHRRRSEAIKQEKPSRADLAVSVLTANGARGSAFCSVSAAR